MVHSRLYGITLVVLTFIGNATLRWPGEPPAAVPVLRINVVFQED